MIQKYGIELPELDKGMNIALNLSGGIDSTTLAHLLVDTYGADKVKALTFNYGQRNSAELEKSIKTAKRLGIYHKIIKLDYLGELVKDDCALIEGSDLKPKTAEENAGDPQIITYVPFRNAQFAMITAAFAETTNCQYIAQATQAGDSYSYWDVTPEFTDAINQVLHLNRINQMKFIGPFQDIYKEEVIQIGFELNKKLDYDMYDSVWSCYRGDNGIRGSKQCGHCSTCEEIMSGYIKAGADNEYIKNKFVITDEELNRLRV